MSLYDEFGHSRIPDFETIATTIRRYRVSISIILQDYGQLVRQYGESSAGTILSGACASKLFYPGLDGKSAEMVQQMMGKVIHTQKNNGMKHRRENHLMNADEITRIHQGEALFLNSNHNPLLLKTVPCYRHPKLKHLLNDPPVPLPEPLPSSKLHFVPLT